MSEHVYVTRSLTPSAMRRLRGLDVPVVVGSEVPPSTRELLENSSGASAILSNLTERIDGPLLDAAGGSLKVVANCAVGFDNIDLAAAQARGIHVTNTPSVLERATADLTLGLILSLARRISEGDRFLRAGREWIWGLNFLVGLDVSAGATLGIIGYGQIGRAVAQRARAFEMRVIALNRSGTTSPDDDGVERVGLGDLLARSDVVSLHCPLTPATRHLINSETLGQMKPSGLLINTARGPIVDEAALVAALLDRRIAGAALDVFEHEPMVDPRLLEMENVIVTPHIGSAGSATRDRMCHLAIDNVLAVLAGQDPLTPVFAAT